MFAANIRVELSSKFVEKSWKVSDYAKVFLTSKASKQIL